jgi:hypothetical protein
MVVLMHDTHSATRDVLPEIIDGLAAQGYSFETIEHYVHWRWNRPSLDLTPGPRCIRRLRARSRLGLRVAGLRAAAARVRASEVCGRLWVAYHALGGAEPWARRSERPERSATRASSRSRSSRAASSFTRRIPRRAT